MLSDLAYAEIYFDGNPPPSILQVPGAREVAVEFSSLSKTYTMAGWRIGFAVGNKRLIAALSRVKSYLDYGAFTPIQVAATAALNGPQECIAEIRERYRAAPRRAGRWAAPGRVGHSGAARHHVRLGAGAAERFRDLGSLEFSKIMLEEANVAVSPGVGFGEYGENYVRIAHGREPPAAAPGDAQHQAVHERPLRDRWQSERARRRGPEPELTGAPDALMVRPLFPEPVS